MRYIGSKTKLLNSFLGKVINPFITETTTLGDLFAGTGVVGEYFTKSTKSVISNDVEYYSFILNKALLCCPYSNKIKKKIIKLNKCEGKEGLIYNHYSPGG